MMMLKSCELERAESHSVSSTRAGPSPTPGPHVPRERSHAGPLLGNHVPAGQLRWRGFRHSGLNLHPDHDAHESNSPKDPTRILDL